MATDREDEETQAAMRKLTDEGRILEAGFLGFRLQVFAGAPNEQIDEARNCFFAGAKFLFNTLMTIMDDDREPTIEDLQRMDNIENELARFIADYELRNLPTRGRG